MALLASVEPYLIWGQYSDPIYNEYVEFGFGTMEEAGSANCYIRYGKLPLEILKEMEEKGKVVYYDYDRDSYYGTSFPTYADKFGIIE